MMMKYIGIIFLIFGLFLSGAISIQASASDADSMPEAAVMDNIYNELLQIKDRYEELKDFGEKNYSKKTHITFGSPILPLWLQIDLSPYTAVEGGYSHIPKEEIYIPKLKHYLICCLQTKNKQLESEIRAIVRKNAELASGYWSHTDFGGKLHKHPVGHPDHEH